MFKAEEAHINQLREWGADEIDHPGGTLLAHLVRTASLLHRWDADDDLVLAGLFHAAYGTDGFAPSLIQLDQRADLQSIIGREAEAIIYTYACCDRTASYPLIGDAAIDCFIDRHTGAPIEMSEQALRDFVELTYANELDLVAYNQEFAAEFGPALKQVFNQWTHLASEPAIAHLHEVLGGN